jgi:hypothetical protein
LPLSSTGISPFQQKYAAERHKHLAGIVILHNCFLQYLMGGGVGRRKLFGDQRNTTPPRIPDPIKSFLDSAVGFSSIPGPAPASHVEPSASFRQNQAAGRVLGDFAFPLP